MAKQLVVFFIKLWEPSQNFAEKTAKGGAVFKQDFEIDDRTYMEIKKRNTKSSVGAGL